MEKIDTDMSKKVIHISFCRKYPSLRCHVGIPFGQVSASLICRCFSGVACLGSASKHAVAQAPHIATSGGRAKGMRREVRGMDARQALRSMVIILARGLQDPGLESQVRRACSRRQQQPCQHNSERWLS
jgi:hypothetical protein